MAEWPKSDQPGSAKAPPSGDLAQRIEAARRARQLPGERADGRPSAEASGMGRAVRLGSEFIAAILVGAGIGYLLDLWLGTQPWIMLVMLLVGFAAGILNITRSVGEMNKAAPPPPGSDLGPDDDEE
jgi:ATP synthase protein I